MCYRFTFKDFIYKEVFNNTFYCIFQHGNNCQNSCSLYIYIIQCGFTMYEPLHKMPFDFNSLCKFLNYQKHDYRNYFYTCLLVTKKPYNYRASFLGFLYFLHYLQSRQAVKPYIMSQKQESISSIFSNHQPQFLLA